MRVEAITGTSHLRIVDLRAVAPRCAACLELLQEVPVAEQAFCGACIDRGHDELDTGGES